MLNKIQLKLSLKYLKKFKLKENYMFKVFISLGFDLK